MNQLRLENISDMAPSPRGASVSKVGKYGWYDPGPCGEFRLVHKDKLAVDESYQRNMKISRVRQIASEFLWASFGCVLVNERPDGTYMVFEGQHRVGAAKMRSDVTYVPCMVFVLPEVSDEAGAFFTVNSTRVGLHGFEKWNSQLIMGDEATVIINAMLKEEGYRVAKSGNNTTACVGALRNSYQRFREPFERVWPLIARMHKGDQIRDNEVKGMVWLEANLADGNSLNSKEWGRKFVQARLSELRETVDRQRRFQGGGERSLGLGVLEFINFGCRRRLELKVPM